MSKRIKYYAIRAILVMAPFVFIACEKSTGEIGLGQVIDSKAVLGVRENVPVKAYTVEFDSILSTGPSQEVVGNYNDPYFGNVDASFSTHLLLSLLSPDFGDEPVCDSVVMYLGYKGYYGDTASPVTFVVSELGDYLDPDSNYYSNQNFTNGQELGRITTIPRPYTTVNDEDVTIAPALRLELDKDYFQSKVINASRLSQGYFVNNVEFVKYMYGLQVSADGAADGLTYFDISSLSSFIKIYYRETPTDTVTRRYEMYYGIFSSGNFVSVNTFRQDFTNAQFDLTSQDTTQGEATIYAQAMGGAVAQIDLSALKYYRDSGYIINRAELILPVRDGSVGKYRLPNSLLLIENRGDSKPFVDDYGSGNLDVGGDLDLADLRDKQYTFNITRLAHRYINTKDSIYPLNILPASSASRGWRAVLNGNQDPVRPLRFNIYFTKTKN
jgi:hypothetical protein